MASFDMVVDTAPMAASILGVQGGVQKTTGAVVAMQAAVIAQEEKTAKDICKNVDNGFYILMKSQLSQKIASCSSIMASKILLMKRFSESIERIKNIMQSDYNRIYRRYKKQFDALNEALKARVHNLDKPSMEIAEIYKKFSDNTKDKSSSMIVSQAETQTTGAKAIGAKLKNRLQKALNVMSSSVTGTINYSQKVEHILKNEPITSNCKNFLASLLLESQSMFDKNTSIFNIYLPKTFQESNGAKVTNLVQQESDSFRWEETSEDNFQKVKECFVKMIETQKVDQRIAAQMLQLFASSKWQETKNKG